MKVIQSTMADTVTCNDECVDKNEHKLNEIQDLLKTHNNPVQDER